MDFLKDWLATERQFQIFTLDDLFSREALALEFDSSLLAVCVIRDLKIVADQHAGSTMARWNPRT